MLAGLRACPMCRCKRHAESAHATGRRKRAPPITLDTLI
jgi:hypothetical protein